MGLPRIGEPEADCGHGDRKKERCAVSQTMNERKGLKKCLWQDVFLIVPFRSFFSFFIWNEKCFPTMWYRFLPIFPFSHFFWYYFLIDLISDFFTVMYKKNGKMGERWLWLGFTIFLLLRSLCHSSRLYRCRPKFPRLPQTIEQRNPPEELSPMFQTSSFTPSYAEIRLSMPTQSTKPVASPKNNATPLLIEIILRFLYIDYYNCVITASKVHFLLPNFLPCPFADFLRVFAVFFGERIAV